MKSFYVLFSVRGSRPFYIRVLLMDFVIFHVPFNNLFFFFLSSTNIMYTLFNIFKAFFTIKMNVFNAQGVTFSVYGFYSTVDVLNE